MPSWTRLERSAGEKRHLLVLVSALAGCGSTGSAELMLSADGGGKASSDASGDVASSDGSIKTGEGSTTSEGGASGEGVVCGTRAGQRGLTHRSVTAAGLDRTYIIYLPPALDPTTPVPFVFVHHGYTMSGQDMVTVTEYMALADSEGFGVAFPDGQGGPNSLEAPWNVGANVCPSTFLVTPDAPGDDFAFLDAMEADVESDQCLDSAHIFLTGFSMGGYFAHQVGCLRPDIRAVAPHSGGTHDLSTCTTGHKPLIIFHGDADPVVPVGCDEPGAEDTPLGFVASATAWASRNGCGTALTTTSVENGECSYYEGCPSDGQVAFCVFKGMVHCWAGGAEDGGVYSCPAYASATELEWQFWKKYAW